MSTAKKFTYSFSLHWSNLLGVLSFGILVPTFFIPLEPWSLEHFILVVVSTITTFIIWEGSKFIQSLVLFYFPWEESSIVKHLFFEIFWIFIFSSVMLIIGILTYGRLVSSVTISLTIILQNVFVSFVLALLFTAINEGTFLFKKWKLSLIEQERLKEENLIAKLESLKKQLDPHFLFNSFSVLSEVIYKDISLADEFITKLSHVYRYVLEHNEETIIDVRKELEFVKAYCFLLNVRFNQKINLEIDIDVKYSRFSVPPLAIQLLVENAVKHNQISENEGLSIKLYLDNNRLWIQNNIQLRSSELRKTSGIGLKNLESRYNLVSHQSIKIQKTDAVFKVGLPLIE